MQEFEDAKKNEGGSRPSRSTANRASNEERPDQNAIRELQIAM